MPFVKIHREKQYTDSLRAYQVYIDGEKKGEIRADSTKDFFLPEGKHSIYLKIDWCGSRELEFNLQIEDTIEFDCGNNTHLFLAFFYVIFAPKEYLRLEKR